MTQYECFAGSQLQLQMASSSQCFMFLQSQTGEELAMEQPARETQKEEEDIHYGEIVFSEPRPEASSTSARDSGQQDTLYAQVKTSQAANSLPQTADGLEDLYAQVKK